MARTLAQIIGGIPMTATAQTVKRGIPNVLPPAFMNVTRRVIGNTVKYKKVAGGRALARAVQYGAPSVLATKPGVSQATAVMIHSFEHITHDPLVLQNLLSADGVLQDQAQEEVDRQSADFAERFNSLRTGAVYSALANGKIWFDSSGNVLFSSSGADVTVDYGVTAAHRNQLNGIISASWATTTTDIQGQVEAIKRASMEETGYPIMHAFYGINIPTYLAKNDSIKNYLIGNPGLAQSFWGNGEIAAGFMGLQWHPVYGAFGLDLNGAVQEFWGPDAITFTPDPSPDWWEFVEGSYAVPTDIAVYSGPQAALAGLQTVFGKFGYATPSHDPVGVVQYAGDTFLPLQKVAGASYIADVTP